MVVRLLLVAEIALADDTPNPRREALLRVEAIEEMARDIVFWQPPVGATTEHAGSKCVEVFI